MSEIDNGGPKFIYGNRGWIAIHRSLRSHWLVGFGQSVKPMDPDRGAFSRGEAFIDLIMECRFEDGYVSNGGRKMLVQAGQLVGAVSWLAHRWNWTPKTVRGFLDRLEEDGTIKVEAPGTKEGEQKGKQSSIITICNYEDYQLVQRDEGQAKGHAEGKQGASKGQAKGNNTKDNTGTLEQGNKVEKTPQPPTGGDPVRDAFETWWGLFPASVRKVAKGECLSLFRQAVTGKRRPDKHGPQKVLDYGTTTPDHLIAAVKAYAASSPNPDFVPAPATWLNQGRWLDTPAASAEVPDAVNGKAWGWWHGKEDAIRAIPIERWRKAVADAKPNGTWPWWTLGAPPGHAECLVPQEILTENQFVEIYRGKIVHD